MDGRWSDNQRRWEQGEGKQNKQITVCLDELWEEE